MAMENLYGFQRLNGVDAAIKRSTAAFCSRLEMSTVVIGVSLSRGEAS